MHFIQLINHIKKHNCYIAKCDSTLAYYIYQSIWVHFIDNHKKPNCYTVTNHAILSFKNFIKNYFISVSLSVYLIDSIRTQLLNL